MNEHFRKDWKEVVVIEEDGMYHWAADGPSKDDQLGLVCFWVMEKACIDYTPRVGGVLIERGSG